MRYTTTDGPKKPLNAIQEGSLGDKMGIADNLRCHGVLPGSVEEESVIVYPLLSSNCARMKKQPKIRLKIRQDIDINLNV